MARQCEIGRRPIHHLENPFGSRGVAASSDQLVGGWTLCFRSRSLRPEESHSRPPREARLQHHRPRRKPVEQRPGGADVKTAEVRTMQFQPLGGDVGLRIASGATVKVTAMVRSATPAIGAIGSGSGFRRHAA